MMKKAAGYAALVGFSLIRFFDFSIARNEPQTFFLRILDTVQENDFL